MNKSPTVSLIMGVYNGETTIKASVESVLSQTFQDYELIIVNDGSTDGTRGLLEGLAQADSRIRLVHQENQGLTRALNVGGALASGKYIARQDADDLSYPDRLQTMVNEMGSAVCAVSAWVNDDGSHRSLPWFSQCVRLGIHFPLPLVWSYFNPFVHGTFLFLREALNRVGMYDPFFIYAQDFDLFLRLSTLGEVKIVRDITYVLGMHGQSISAKRMKEQMLYAMLASLKHRNAGRYDELRNSAVHGLQDLIVELARSNPIHAATCAGILALRYRRLCLTAELGRIVIQTLFSVSARSATVE